MRKRLITLAVFLFVGALVNTAVAWSWAYRRPVWYGMWKPYGDRHAAVVTLEAQMPRWAFGWQEQQCATVYWWSAEYSDTADRSFLSVDERQFEMEYIYDPPLVPHLDDSRARTAATFRSD